MSELIAAESRTVVRVRSPQASALRDLLAERSLMARSVGEQTLEVDAATTDDVGVVAAQAGLTILELTTLTASLEDAYLALTGESVEYAARDSSGRLAGVGVSTGAEEI
jgi:ABC-2 type transport system ATP-binding protein